MRRDAAEVGGVQFLEGGGGMKVDRPQRVRDKAAEGRSLEGEGVTLPSNAARVHARGQGVTEGWRQQAGQADRPLFDIELPQPYCGTPVSLPPAGDGPSPLPGTA